MNRSISLCILILAGSMFSVCAMADDAVLNFGPEEIIKAKGQEIVVPGFSVPSFVDWNNDHLQDLVVGEGGALTATTPAKVRVYLNRGTESDPCFTDCFYVQSNGQDLTLTPQGCMGCFPRVVDWNGDGKKDLLVGQFGGGKLRVYLNKGTDAEPKFDDFTYLQIDGTDATVPPS